ncbi:MAG: lysophospholipase [Acidimicrobiaceae bacterium]|nr:lysophospholipase [Acidimicrobiia bacterium]MCY4493108.1 lysophospholipase [Acidimicrobiaceae bacterium]
MQSTIDYGTTRDGLIQMRRRWRADNPARAAVLLLHGIAEHSGRYGHVGQRLAAAGFDTVAIDHRGYGRSGGRRGHCDWWSQFSDDVADQLFEVRKLGLPTVLLGHSLGGLMATRYVVDERPQPDLLVLSGPALGAELPLHLRIAAPLLGRLLPRLEIRDEGDPSLLSSDPRVGEVFYADPLRVPNPTARMGMEILRAISQARAGIERVTMPTLVVHGGADALVPTETSEIFETLPNAERIVYPGFRHEVFNEPSGPEVIDRVVAWINAHL